MTVKTAKDLPIGAEVETFWSVITKINADQWANRMSDTFTNTEIDALLGNGGMLTRVPVGPQARQEALMRVAHHEREQP